MKLIRDVDGDLVEFEARLVHKTEKAYLIDYGGKEYWIPKSKVEQFDEVPHNPGFYEIVIPEWLADEKELT